MKARNAIVIVLMSVQLAGCGWLRDLWPWGRKDVPVTPPSKTDANQAEVIPGPARPDTAPGPTTRVAPRTSVSPRLAVRPPSKIHRPTDLTDLLYGPEVVPGPASRPATSRPAAPGPGPGTPVVAVRRIPPAMSQPATSPADANTPTPGIRRVTAPPRITPSAHTPGTAKRGVVGTPEVVTASALQVNNSFITVDDILAKLRPRLRKVPAGISETTFRHRVGPWIYEEIQTQVARTLVLAEAEKRLTDEQKEAVKVEVRQAEAQMLADAGGSRTRLQQMLAKEGTTLDGVLTDHYRQAAVRMFLRARFMPAITVNRKTLWTYYNTHRDEFTTEKKVQMQIIAAPLKAFYPKGVANPSALERAAAKKQAKELIEKAAAAVRAGEDFAEVAKRLSRGIKAADGGLWPLMAADSFRETKVEQAAFGLKEGQAAGPIETEAGFWLVRANRIKPGKVVSFEDAQADITDKLRDRQYRKLVDDYLKKLHEAATIVRSERFGQIVMDKTVERYWQK